MLLEVWIGLKEASLKEHEYGIGQRLGRPISRTEAEINWITSGYEDWLFREFHSKIDKIMEYCEKNQIPCRIGTIPKFTETDLHNMLDYASSNLSGNRIFYMKN
ncbi:MAG TPA: hypothetical protein P5205_14785 [Candidatus Paceibacterota bacterium]|nr:hypothetical protein [Verrucomicrobiota bacterium]HSA11627.1 hypothetical protein [Candidatus Paceibacterota bacterium]